MKQTESDHNNSKLKIIIFFGIIVVISVAYATLFYYRASVKSEDPRILIVHQQHDKYDKLMKNEEYIDAMKMLDSIEATYLKFDDYKKSYEVGLIMNSKAVNWLTIALSESNDSIKLNFLDSAKVFASRSINTLEYWIKEFTHLSRNEIIIKIGDNYTPDYNIFKERNLVDIINKRADDIITAQKETPKQLSIAYTNLGTVYQYIGDYKKAIHCNRKALEIWNENKTAKYNISNLIEMPTK